MSERQLYATLPAEDDATEPLDLPLVANAWTLLADYTPRLGLMIYEIS
jgi:hypothetical protein